MFVLLSFIWFVQFTDKAQSTLLDFSPRAVEQRERWEIPYDSLDYTVSEVYVDSLRKVGAKIHHVSRWMNGVTVEMSDSIATVVKQWSMVRAVECTRSDTRSSVVQRRKIQRESTYDAPLSSDCAYPQQQMMNLPALHALDFKGEGILMAVCDGGFMNYDTLSNFDKTHYKGYFDFTDDKEGFFSWTGSHGTHCLSTIAGHNGQYSGSALGADYYLMRSEEYSTESRKEVDNLVAALEKADSLGVNIFSVSLGYTLFDDASQDFSYSDMDGKTSRASLAATIAARKGMLVCSAAGNEGDKTWHYIASAADADSILTVGAVDTLGAIAGFSSRGPSSDGRIKPDVCAVGKGTCIINSRGAIQYGNGTSFACPLLAGSAACLWSALPDETNMQIRDRILRSSHRYSQPNYNEGYGIPDFLKAYTGYTPTEVVDVAVGQSRKVVRDGRILILHAGQYYDLLGRAQKKE